MLESTQFSLVISLVDSDPRTRHTVPTVEGPGSVPSDPLPYRAVYAACKAFIVTFTVSLHRELQGTGVRLMVCCPGLVESEFHGPDWQGPPQMSAEDVVTACFRELEEGEAICLPGIEDPQVVDALDAAERAMIAHTRVTSLAG
jgi:short-subunit dehydrogenase